MNAYSSITRSEAPITRQNVDNEEDGDSREYRRLEKMALKGLSHPLLDIFRESTSGLPMTDASRTSSDISIDTTSSLPSFRSQRNEQTFEQEVKLHGSKTSGSGSRASISYTRSLRTQNPSTPPPQSESLGSHFAPYMRSQSCSNISEKSQISMHAALQTAPGGRHLAKIQPKRPLSDTLSDIKEDAANNTRNILQKERFPGRPQSKSKNAPQRRDLNPTTANHLSFLQGRTRARTLSSASSTSLHPYHRTTRDSLGDFTPQHTHRVSAAYIDTLDKFQNDIESYPISTKYSNVGWSDTFPDRDSSTAFINDHSHPFRSHRKFNTKPATANTTKWSEGNIGSRRMYHSMMDLPGLDFNSRRSPPQDSRGIPKPKLVNLKRARPQMRRASSHQNISQATNPINNLPSIYQPLDTMVTPLLPPIGTTETLPVADGSVFNDLLGFEDLLSFPANDTVLPNGIVPPLAPLPFDALLGLPERKSLVDESLSLSSPLDYESFTPSPLPNVDDQFGVLANDWDLVFDALPLESDLPVLPGIGLPTSMQI